MSEHADPFTAVIDTNILFGALKRNLVLTLAAAGFFRPRWSATTLDELERALLERLGSEDKAHQQRQRIEIAFPEARTDVPTGLVDSLGLPDPDDRHVLAAAIQASAAVIVTDNISDFPAHILARHDIEAVRLDDFLADCIDMAGVEAIAAIRDMRQRFARPEIDAEELVRKIETLTLSETAKLLTEFKAVL